MNHLLTYFLRSNGPGSRMASWQGDISPLNFALLKNCQKNFLSNTFVQKCKTWE